MNEEQHSVHAEQKEDQEFDNLFKEILKKTYIHGGEMIFESIIYMLKHSNAFTIMIQGKPFEQTKEVLDKIAYALEQTKEKVFEQVVGEVFEIEWNEFNKDKEQKK